MLLILIAHDPGSPCKICLGFSVESPASCSLSIQIKKHFLIAYHLYLLQDCNLRISISYPPTPERFLLLIVCSFIMHKKICQINATSHPQRHQNKQTELRIFSTHNQLCKNSAWRFNASTAQAPQAAQNVDCSVRHTWSMMASTQYGKAHPLKFLPSLKPPDPSHCQSYHHCEAVLLASKTLSFQHPALFYCPATCQLANTPSQKLPNELESGFQVIFFLFTGEN